MEHEVRKRKFLKFLLVYLIMSTSALSIITLSKYTSTSAGNGSMKIAKWDVTLNTSDNTSDNINIISGNNTVSYTLKVKSLSEVKVGYTIKISNVPNDILVKLDNGSNTSPTSGVVTFSNVGVINANATTREVTHTLTFSAPLSANVISKTFDIDVIFTQLQ